MRSRSAGLKRRDFLGEPAPLRQCGACPAETLFIQAVRSSSSASRTDAADAGSSISRFMHRLGLRRRAPSRLRRAPERRPGRVEAQGRNSARNPHLILTVGVAHVSVAKYSPPRTVRTALSRRAFRQCARSTPTRSGAKRTARRGARVAASGRSIRRARAPARRRRVRLPVKLCASGAARSACHADVAWSRR